MIIHEKKVVYLLIFCLFNFSSVISADEKKLKIKIQNLMCLLECLILVIMAKDQL